MNANMSFRMQLTNLNKVAVFAYAFIKAMPGGFTNDSLRD